jgi:hypothetical protein
MYILMVFLELLLYFIKDPQYVLEWKCVKGVWLSLGK